MNRLVGGIFVGAALLLGACNQPAAQTQPSTTPALIQPTATNFYVKERDSTLGITLYLATSSRVFLQSLLATDGKGGISVQQVAGLPAGTVHVCDMPAEVEASVWSSNDPLSKDAAQNTCKIAAAPTPQAWVQVAHFAGRNRQNTTTFTVGSQWRIHVVNHGDSNIIVDAVTPGSRTATSNGDYIGITNSIGNFDQVSQEYAAGTYYLDVDGNTWDITIENYQ